MPHQNNMGLLCSISNNQGAVMSSKELAVGDRFSAYVVKFKRSLRGHDPVDWYDAVTTVLVIYSMRACQWG